MNRLLLFPIAMFIIAACSSEIEVPQTIEIPITVKVPETVIVPVTVKVERTVLVPVTVIVTPTHTPGPSSTPTSSPTPTPTLTPTATPTPFSVAGCRDLRISFNETTTDDQIESQFRGFHQRCVRVIYDPSDGYVTTDFMLYLVKLQVKTDEGTPLSVSPPKKYSFVWGVFYASGEQPQETKEDMLVLRRVDEQPANRSPIQDEGLYLVGEDGEIAPGLWESALLPTWTDSCYWARLNSATGSIKSNHFGIGGMAVRVYEGEVFETNGECTPWYYVGP